MIEINFTDIITKNRFGLIKFGDSIDKVIDVLGKPDGFSNPEVYKNGFEAITYGYYEFTFHEKKVIMFHNKYLLGRNFRLTKSRVNFSNDKFTTIKIFNHLDNDISISSFRNYFKENKIRYKEDIFCNQLLRFTINKLQLLFISYKINFDPDPHNVFDPTETNLKLCAFYCDKDFPKL
ncbi:MAG: hypothetical protein U0U67_15890 [Chitinophagales bacterium]